MTTTIILNSNQRLVPHIIPILQHRHHNYNNSDNPHEAAPRSRAALTEEVENPSEDIQPPAQNAESQKPDDDEGYYSNYFHTLFLMNLTSP